MISFLPDRHGFRLSFVFKEFCVSFSAFLRHFDDSVFVDTFERFLADLCEFFGLHRHFFQFPAASEGFLANSGYIGADGYFFQFLRFLERIIGDSCYLYLLAVDGDSGRNLYRFLIGHFFHGYRSVGGCLIRISAHCICASGLQSNCLGVGVRRLGTDIGVWCLGCRRLGYRCLRGSLLSAILSGWAVRIFIVLLFFDFYKYLLAFF